MSLPLGCIFVESDHPPGERGEGERGIKRLLLEEKVTLKLYREDSLEEGEEEVDEEDKDLVSKDLELSPSPPP